MSGGHYNYKYSSIRDTYKGELENPLLEDLLEDVVELLRSLEWYKSGDTSQEIYHQNIDIFIEKWIKKDFYDSMILIINFSLQLIRNKSLNLRLCHFWTIKKTLSLLAALA